MNLIIKKFLFSLNPERAHYVALKSLNLIYRCGLSKYFMDLANKSRDDVLLTNKSRNNVSIMGLNFPNRVGLAAGFDKNGDYIDALSMLGFGFIEIGTITPKPQTGNPKPRLFRLTKEEAIINRMGFNNKGADYVAHQLEKINYRGILGINIGKNKDTPLENSIDDYLIGFKKFWKFASYITINISSPNTPGLRDLQQDVLLSNLLSALKQEQQSVFLNHQKYVPLVVKISPDLSQQELESVANILLKEKIDGVIATNTTLRRDEVQTSIHAKEAGGLSGKPLNKLNTEIIKNLFSILQNQIPIIASGGVMNADTAQEKINAGAKLIQIYSGFIFSGQEIIKNIVSRVD